MRSVRLRLQRGRKLQRREQLCGQQLQQAMREGCEAERLRPVQRRSKERLVLDLHAAAAAPGVLLITAGNYGGKLGKHHFALRDLLSA